MRPAAWSSLIVATVNAPAVEIIGTHVRAAVAGGAVADQSYAQLAPNRDSFDGSEFRYLDEATPRLLSSVA